MRLFLKVLKQLEYNPFFLSFLQQQGGGYASIFLVMKHSWQQIVLTSSLAISVSFLFLFYITW
jgi:hypothetical protein